MASNEELAKAYLRMCFELAKLSKAVRKQVGSLIVKDTHIIAEGYNGTLSGRPNRCEEYKDTSGNYINVPKGQGEWVTKREVVHAEMNCIAKAAKVGISCDGAIFYCTLSPCLECVKLLIASGISKVIFCEKYRDESGLDLLRECGIPFIQIPIHDIYKSDFVAL